MTRPGGGQAGTPQKDRGLEHGPLDFPPTRRPEVRRDPREPDGPSRHNHDLRGRAHRRDGAAAQPTRRGGPGERQFPRRRFHGRGTRHSTRVPAPGSLATWTVPPRASARSRMLRSPLERITVPMPRPLSLTRRISLLPALSVTAAVDAPAWRAVFDNASRRTASNWIATLPGTAPMSPSRLRDGRSRAPRLPRIRRRGSGRGGCPRRGGRGGGYRSLRGPRRSRCPAGR